MAFPYVWDGQVNVMGCHHEDLCPHAVTEVLGFNGMGLCLGSLEPSPKNRVLSDL